MNCSEYLNLLNTKYGKYFDVDYGLTLLNEKIDLFAQFKVTSTRNFITKNDIVDSYENNEYCFVKSFKNIQKEDINRFIQFLKSANEEYVKPGHNHMSTYITGIMVTDSDIDINLENHITGFKYIKPYKFYLNGWSEIRLVLVDLKNDKLFLNKSAGKVKKVYQLTP